MGRDEDDERRVGPLAQAVGKLQAIGARHLHVEQHQVAGVLAQPSTGLRASGGLGHDLQAQFAALVVDGLDEAAQAQAGQGSSSTIRDLEGIHRKGTTMRRL